MPPVTSSVNHIPCPFCGCLCDDIGLEVEGEDIIKNHNGCAISRAKFLNRMSDRMLRPSVSFDGIETEVTLDEALKRATELLANAQRPLIYGLSSTENDAHREAYRIAELLRGVVDNTSSVCHGTSIMGVQESGEPIGSFGEIRNRADLVLYWGANPLAAHPRHISRYLTPKGEYVTKRSVWVFDIRETATAAAADRFVRIEPGHDLEVLSVLRALVRGHNLDVRSAGGVPIDDLREMAAAMKAASYGVLFYGLGLAQSRGQFHNTDAAIRLVQDLNSFTKWSMMPMRGHYNVAGANKTSTWTTGYPFAVDYSRGYPRYQPGEYGVVDLLANQEVDAVLNVAADPASHLPLEAVRHLSRIPVVNLDPRRNLTASLAAVNIPTAIAGIECDGVAVRMDGLPLYLKKVVEPPEGVFPDRTILGMLYARLAEVSRR